MQFNKYKGFFGWEDELSNARCFKTKGNMSHWPPDSLRQHLIPLYTPESNPESGT